MAEVAEIFSCFVCNVSGLPLSDGTAIFDDNAVLSSGLKLWEAVSQVVGCELDPLAAHSHIICSKCYKTCEEFDEINKRLTSLKSKMTSQFRQTLPNYDLTYGKCKPEVKTEPTDPRPIKTMKTLVVPRSKLTPLPNIVLRNNSTSMQPRNINKPISLKNCVFVSPNKVTLPGASLIRATQTVTMPSQKVSIATTSRGNTSYLHAPSTSTGATKNMSFILESHGDPMEDKSKRASKRVKDIHKSPQKNVRNAVFHFKSEDLQNKVQMFKNAVGKSVQRTNKSQQQSDKFVISEVEIMQHDNEHVLDDDGEDAILMDQNGAILRVVRKDQNNLMFPQVEEISLVMPEEAELDSDTQGHFKIEDQDSSNDGQIELQMSGFEDSSAAIISTASKQGTTYIKMDSGEVYCFKGMENTEPASIFNTMVERSNGTYKCLLCRNSSKAGDGNRESEDEETEKPEATFKDPIATIMHIKKVHRVRVYYCPVCLEFFRKRNEMVDHMNKEHTVSGENANKAKESEKTKNSPKGNVAVKKIINSHKLHQCSICLKKYVSRNLLEEHMNFHTGQRPYSCTDCDKNFASKYTYKTHLNTHKERPRPFMCSVCSKTFLSFQNLSQHMRTHTGVKDYQCNMCSKAFATQHNLDVHSIVHTGRKPFACGVCKKAFARKAEIRDHLRTHTGERPYACDMCSARFAQQSNLISHKRATHLNDRRHACNLCDKRFKRKRLLDYHIKANHTGERPYKCDECSATFVYPEHHRKHMRVHSGERPFVCEVCNRKFNSRDNRNAHRFTHSDKKPYECLVCGAGFMRKPLLYAHMNTQGHLTDMIVVNQARLSDNDIPAATKAVDTIMLNDNSEQATPVFVEAGISDMLDKKIIIESTRTLNECEMVDDNKHVEGKAISLMQTGDHDLATLTHTIAGDAEGDQDLLGSSEVEELLAQGSEVLTTDEQGNIVHLVQIQLPDGKSGWVALDT